MNIEQIFSQDIERVASEKLASLVSDMEKVAGKKKKKNKFDAKDFAYRAGASATGAFLTSLLHDIRTKPVEFAKEKLYSAIESAGSRVMHRL